MEVKAPRVSDVLLRWLVVASKDSRRYERTSRQTQDLFRKLYLELSTGDFDCGIESERDREVEEQVGVGVSGAGSWKSAVHLGWEPDREKTALRVVGAREDGVRAWQRRVGPSEELEGL